MTESRQLLAWSVVANVVGGVLILLASLAMLVMVPMMSMMGGMMGMSTGGGMMIMIVPLALLGVFLGALVLFVAHRIRQKPEDARAWGTAAIVAGVLSLLSMGGFLLGAAATITGGILAILAGSPARVAEPPPSGRANL